MADSPPVHEAPAETTHPSGFPKYWIVLGLLVLAHAVFGVCTIQFINHRTPVSEAVCIAAILWQSFLFAVWSAFASQRFWVRSLCGLLSCAVVASIEQFWATLCEPSRNADSLVQVSLVCFCVSTLILSGLRYYCRWRIIRNPPVVPHPTGQKHQFTLRGLIYVTTLIAVCCGGVRTLLILDPGRDFLPIFCELLAYVFPAIIVPWIILADGNRVRALLLAILVGGGLVLAEYLMIRENPPSLALRRQYNFIESMLLVQLGSGASAIVSFLVLRFCGFRMVRLPTRQHAQEIATGSGISH